MLSNLQVLRGVAALGVVFFHTGYRLSGDWHTEFFGVAIFFVISGFIMCAITRAPSEDFLARRVVRIVPLYWLCTLVLLVVMFGTALLDPALWRAPLDGRPGEPLWAYVSRSLSFSPLEDRYPILNVGWSLNYEMYFYLVFALALSVSRRWAPLLVVIGLVAANQLHAACGAAPCHYLSFELTKFFIAGILVFYAGRWQAPRRRPATIALCAALVTLCYGSQFVGPWWAGAVSPGIYALLAGAAPIAIVSAALVAERAGGAITWRPLILLGDASYALYLTHPILFELLRQAATRWPGLPSPAESAAAMLAHLALAVLLGVAVHLYVELPLLRAVRRRQAARPPALPVAAAHPG